MLRLPHPYRVLCDKVGILIFLSSITLRLAIDGSLIFRPHTKKRECNSGRTALFRNYTSTPALGIEQAPAAKRRECNPGRTAMFRNYTSTPAIGIEQVRAAQRRECNSGRTALLRNSTSSLAVGTNQAPAAQRRNLDSPTRECGEHETKGPESASADGTQFRKRLVSPGFENRRVPSPVGSKEQISASSLKRSAPLRH